MTPAQRVRTLPARWRRITAGCVDLGLSALGSGLLVAANVVDTSRWFPTGELALPEHVAVTLHATRGLTAAEWTLLWIPVVLFHSVFALMERETPGNTLLRLRVVGPDGHAPSRVRGLVRAIGYLTWPLTLGLAAVWAWVSRDQRGPHDRLARTWVVRQTPRR